MNSRAAAQALVPGRAVMIVDSSSGLTELGVICGAVPAAKTGIQLGSSPAASMLDDAFCRPCNAGHDASCSQLEFWGPRELQQESLCCC